jgi:hypothetical protein
MAENPPASPPSPSLKAGCESGHNRFSKGILAWDHIALLAPGFLILLVLLISRGCRFTDVLARVRQKESQVMGTALRNGIDQFLADYGRLPLPAGSTSATADLDTDSGVLSGLVSVLSGKETPSPSRQNPRNTDYLEGLKPAKPNKKPGGPPWINGLIWDPALSVFSIVDGWGSFYRVRLDTDGDGLVENPSPNEVAEGRPQLKQRVIVWSPGKDGKDETWEDNPKSWE